MPDSNDYIHAMAILGGFNCKCASQQFRGGDFTAIMGEGKIDLRDAQMDGDEAVIDVFTVMGGMEIQVPMDWIVEQGFVPILGGYDDKTRKVPGKSKRLLLHGTTIMGGISVANWRAPHPRKPATVGVLPDCMDTDRCPPYRYSQTRSVVLA